MPTGLARPQRRPSRRLVTLVACIVAGWLGVLVLGVAVADLTAATRGATSAGALEVCADMDAARVHTAALRDAPAPVGRAQRRERAADLRALAQVYTRAAGHTEIPHHHRNSLRLVATVIHRTADRITQPARGDTVHDLLAATAPSTSGIVMWCRRGRPPI